LDDLSSTEDENERPSLETFEVNSVILVGEEEQENPKGNFTCYFNNQTKDFFLEIDNIECFEGLTKSSFLNILQLARQSKAENVYICIEELDEFEARNGLVKKNI